MSFVLRHQPEAIGLALDAEDWGGVDDLITSAARHGRQLSRELIEQVVAINDKQPDVLFHGTASRFVAAISREGLKPGLRHHVHLSADEQTARAVGLRYRLPVVLVVDAARKHAQGFVFHQAENGVWLTARVSPAFLHRTR